MKSFLVTILNQADSQKVMQILQDLQKQKLIEVQENTTAPVSPTYEQVEEILDESELGPYYIEAEAKAILHL